MPRQARVAPGGLIYHVLNRAVGRMHMFRRDADFLAFQNILLEAHARIPLSILSYCILSNHWHFVVAPAKDGQLSDFFRWLTLTHAMRWRVSHRTLGYGHLYQGRFKSFPVQRDEHFLTLARYVERNAQSAALVDRAEDWRWSSLWTRRNGSDEMKAVLSDWPVDRPRNWVEVVNRPMREKEIRRVQESMTRQRPLGSDRWTGQMAARLNLTHTLRDPGRPAKLAKDDKK